MSANTAKPQLSPLYRVDGELFVSLKCPSCGENGVALRVSSLLLRDGDELWGANLASTLMHSAHAIVIVGKDGLFLEIKHASKSKAIKPSKCAKCANEDHREYLTKWLNTHTFRVSDIADAARALLSVENG